VIAKGLTPATHAAIAGTWIGKNEGVLRQLAGVEVAGKILEDADRRVRGDAAHRDDGGHRNGDEHAGDDAHDDRADETTEHPARTAGLGDAHGALRRPVCRRSHRIDRKRHG